MPAKPISLASSASPTPCESPYSLYVRWVQWSAWDTERISPSRARTVTITPSIPGPSPQVLRTTAHVNLKDIQVVKKFLLQDQYFKSYLP